VSPAALCPWLWLGLQFPLLPDGGSNAPTVISRPHSLMTRTALTLTLRLAVVLPLALALATGNATACSCLRPGTSYTPDGCR